MCVKLREVELLHKVCKAVCSNFARVGRVGGEGELVVFKKRGGAQLQAASGGALEDNIKKKKFGSCKGTEIDTSGGGGAKAPIPP